MKRVILRFRKAKSRGPRRGPFAVAAVLLLAPAAHAQTAQALADKALAGSSAYAVVESLVTDIGPRPVGSPAMTRAKDWALKTLAAAGLKNVHAEPFDAWAWRRGAESAHIVGDNPQALALVGLGDSVPTVKGGVEADVAAFATYDAMLAQPPGALAGKIALVNQAMTRTQDGSGYGALNRMRTRGASEAARRGAVAYLIRSLSTDDTRLPHTGMTWYAKDAPKIPAAALAGADADMLQRLAARGPVRVRLDLASQHIDRTTSWNVVGEIPGREAPDEVVLIGAHLDSWDNTPGANDDGAGVAIVTVAAELVARLPEAPRRTVRVVLFGAEETDQSGAAYAAAHKGEAGKIVLASESDFGSGRPWQVQLPAGFAAAPDGKVLAAVLDGLGAGVGPDPAKRGGSDVQPLAQLGVPVFAVRPDGMRYFDLHHSADDTLDKIDRAGLDANVAAWAAIVWTAAETREGFR